MADDFDRFAFNREANDWDEFSSLGALDDAPPPNPRFVRALRGELMSQAVSMSGSAMIRGQMSTTAGSLSAPLPTPIPVRTRFDRRLRFELAAVAILLLSLIGSISLYNNNNGNGDANNILNGMATQSSQEDQPFALYHGDAARTGISPEDGPIAIPEVVWRQQMTNPDLAPALAVDGVIYLVDAEGGEVQAVSATTGMPFWGATVGRMASPSIAVANGFVYVVTQGPEAWGGDPGYLIALKRDDGKEQWRYEYGGSSYSAPAVDDGHVYLISNAGTLRVVNATSGAEEWQLDISGTATPSNQASPEAGILSGLKSTFSPVVSNGTVYVTSGGGTLYAVDVESHEIKWTFQSDGNFLDTAAVSDGQIFVPATLVPDPMTGSQEAGAPKDDGWVYALNAVTGEVNWTWNAGGRVGDIRVIGDQLTVRSQDLGLQALAASTGAPIWGLAGASLDQANETIVTEGMMYITHGASIEAYVQVANQGATLIWSANTGVGYISPVTVNDMLVSRGPDGTLIALGEGSTVPESSPISGNATPTAIDVSGLAACEAPAGIDWQNASGEPANSFAPVGNSQSVGQPAAIAFADLPTGNPASRDAEAGILLTLHDIEKCNHFGNTTDVSGFFSEDFFRRAWVNATIENNPSYGPISFFPGAADGRSDYSFDDIQQLADGRVSAFAQVNPGYGILLIFTERDGIWVIDESIQVTQNPGGQG